MLLGRPSVYMINFIVFIGCFQLMIIYFIIIGDIFSSFMTQIFNVNNIFTGRGLGIIIVAAALTPLTFKKELAELKIASLLLFFSIFLFVLVFLFQMIESGADQNVDEDFSEYY